MPRGLMPFKEIVVVGGLSNEPLTKKVYEELVSINNNYRRGRSTKVSLGSLTDPRRHKDGESRVQYADNLRGKDIFIIQSTNQPDSNLMELLFMIDTAFHASAGRVTAVIPYFGYARADKKNESRECVPIALIPKFFKAASTNRVILLDVHSPVTKSTFQSHEIIADELFARPFFTSYLKSHPKEAEFLANDFVVVGSDRNAGNLAKAYARDFGDKPIATVYKTRPKIGDVKIIHVEGDVRDKDVLAVDDMIDTAGTQLDGAEALKNRGARDIYAVATHGVFSGNAQERIDNSCIKRVFVSDSIAGEIKSPKIMRVSVAKLLAEAIWRTHMEKSVSSLFNEESFSFK